MYERETRRERLLGGIEREGRTRLGGDGREEREEERWEEREVEREESMKRAERKFFDIIREERESRVAELNTLMSFSEKEL